MSSKFEFDALSYKNAFYFRCTKIKTSTILYEIIHISFIQPLCLMKATNHCTKYTKEG